MNLQFDCSCCNTVVSCINGTKYTTSYTYDNDNRVSSVVNGNASEAYTYDAYSRLSKKVTKNNGTTVLTDNLTYRNPTTTTTAGQVATLATTTNSSGYSATYTYTYDDNGNIATIKVGGKTTKYTYDSANQLIREDNEATGQTWVWSYDSAGNITSRKQYAYTTATNPGTVQATVTYTYGDTAWKDLLTKYNGKTITYDTIGNPLSDGTWTYTWEHGRELATMSNGSTTWTYTYNADGLRTKRTDGTTTYQYVYNGGSLSQMTVGSNTLYFAYDASGSPMSVTYNGTTYYYALNLQGDVMAILNASGTSVVTYTYDAWGNILSSGGTMASTLGTYNPLRYRGYVYDNETELYYLQSRYYNPEMGRFLNADDVSNLGADDGLVSFNLFAYCTNNPVNRFDDSGNWSLPNWAKVAIGVGIIAAAAVVTVATGGAAAGTLVAAVHCAAQGALVGAVTQGAIGAVTGGISGAVMHRMTTGSWSGATNAAIDGAASGFMTGTITGAISGAISSPYCFTAGTMVLAAAGAIPIEEICKGDMVWAWDEETGDVALKRVVETYVNETDELIHIFVNGEEIVTTPSHPFYSPVKGWTDAVHLRAGDILVLVNGEYVVIEKVQHEILEAPIAVYNFQVEDYHTYYVTDAGVLVHNKCIESSDIYNSVRESPDYISDFVKVQNGTKKVNINNQSLLSELRKYGTGWKKVYSDGYLNEMKTSLHYFQDATGKVFNIKYKSGWSVLTK